MRVIRLQAEAITHACENTCKHNPRTDSWYDMHTSLHHVIALVCGLSDTRSAHATVLDVLGLDDYEADAFTIIESIERVTAEEFLAADFCFA